MVGSSLIPWLFAPLSRWHLASPVHKLVAVAAGAGVAYYVHTKRGWAPWQVTAAGVGTAYTTSLALHTAALVHASIAQAQAQAVLAAAPQAKAALPAQEAQPEAQEAAPQQEQSNVVDLQARISAAQAAYKEAAGANG